MSRYLIKHRGNFTFAFTADNKYNIFKYVATFQCV